MTADGFRKLALGFPGSSEGAHMGHPDFRAHGRIFATLPKEGLGMVKLTPEQQNNFVRAAPEMFQPVPGGWGRGGATTVLLKAAKTPIVRKAMGTAIENLAGKKPPRKRSK